MTEISTKATIPAETRGKNKYIYDRRLKKMILCHPILYFLSQKKIRGEDIERWIENLGDHPVEIPGAGTFPVEDVVFYYRKLLLLEDAGFFTEIYQEKMLSRELTAAHIQSTLANLIQVTFELTDACQMDCFYCGYGKFYNNYDNRENKHMDFPMIKQMLDYLNELVNSPLNQSHNRLMYVGFYGGEPLLDFHLIEETVHYVNHLQWLHNSIHFTVTTNGLLLDKHMDFLVEHDFNIFISLDGDEKNNAYRILKNGKPAFEPVFKNVKKLQKKYPEFFKARVFFNAVLHNKNSVEDLFNYFRNQFDKNPTILSLNTGGIREDQVDEFWKMYVNEKESLYNSEDYSRIEKEMFIKLPTVQDVSSFIFASSDFYYNDYNHFFTIKKIDQKFPTSTCSPFSKKLFLTVNGKIMACERIGQKFGLGWLTPEGIEFDFQDIADRYNRWFSMIRKQCRSCYIFDRCSQCIFFLDLKSGKPICSNIHNFADYSRRISSFLDYFEGKPGMFNRIVKEVTIE